MFEQIHTTVDYSCVEPANWVSEQIKKLAQELRNGTPPDSLPSFVQDLTSGTNKERAEQLEEMTKDSIVYFFFNDKNIHGLCLETAGILDQEYIDQNLKGLLPSQVTYKDSYLRFFNALLGSVPKWPSLPIWKKSQARFLNMSKKSRAISNTYDLRSSVFGVTSVSRKGVFPSGNTPMLVRMKKTLKELFLVKLICNIFL